MTTKVDKSIVVNVPVSTVYNQWTQFEDFPQFMGGITSVTQHGDNQMTWVAEIAGVKRQWEARVLEQVPDRRVSWAATEGATNAGDVSFEPVGDGQTRVTLHLEYEPEGLVEKVGDKLNVVENQAEGDLERFKKFVESEGYATGAWRGTISGPGHTPTVSDATQSRGDDGKAGVSGKAVAAGVGAAVAAAAGVAAAVAGAKSSDDETRVETTTTETTTTAPGTATYTPADDVTGGTTFGAVGTAAAGAGEANYADQPVGSVDAGAVGTSAGLAGTDADLGVEPATSVDADRATAYGEDLDSGTTGTTSIDADRIAGTTDRDAADDLDANRRIGGI